MALRGLKTLNTLRIFTTEMALDLHMTQAVLIYTYGNTKKV